MNAQGISEFVKRMREIGDRWTRKILAPLPEHSRRRGQLQGGMRWRRMARGRWIPPRKRQPRRVPVGANIELKGRKR